MRTLSNYEAVKLWRKRHPREYREQMRRKSKTPNGRARHYRNVRRHKDSMNKKLLPFAHSHRVMWSTDEDEYIMNSTLSTRQVAEKLGRTWWSISSRRSVIRKKIARA